jgi:hypothetical protein
VKSATGVGAAAGASGGVHVTTQRGVHEPPCLRQRRARRRCEGAAHLPRQVLHNGAPHLRARVALNGTEQPVSWLLPAVAPPRDALRQLAQEGASGLAQLRLRARPEGGEPEGGVSA